MYCALVRLHETQTLRDFLGKPKHEFNCQQTLIPVFPNTFVQWAKFMCPRKCTLHENLVPTK